MAAVFAVWISAAAYAGDSANGAARNDAGNRLCTDGSADVEDSVCTVDAVGFADIEGSTASLRGIRRQELFAVDRTDTARAVSCYRIPAITTAPDGSLIAAIDERVPSCGDLKWSRDINIVMRRSTDGGRTWSPIRKVVDFPDGQSASDPSLITDTVSGTVFLFYNYMDHDAAKDVYFFHVMRSTDPRRPSPAHDGQPPEGPAPDREHRPRPYLASDTHSHCPCRRVEGDRAA